MNGVKTKNLEENDSNENSLLSPMELNGHGLPPSDHSTNYWETLTHLFRGNVGPGLFAMGYAIKNAGIIVGPILTVILGFICVHSQHILLKYSKNMQERCKLKSSPDFAETVGLCFEHCSHPKLRNWSKSMKVLVNIFLCVTQLGICCVYFLFISSNFKQIFDQYGLKLDIQIHMLLILVPILLPSLILNLKYLAWCSTMANICMITGIGITMYYAAQDLPLINERHLSASLGQLPLFFGTAIYAFEGISLVLPLQNEMKKPKNFVKKLGVLNIGMILVTTIFTIFGSIGYLKYGEEIEGSMTLNLPKDQLLAQSVKFMIAIGVLLTYALQFYVPVQIMWPTIKDKFDYTKQHGIISEMIFRTFLVILTFLIAESIPNLNLFIPLIGSLCSNGLSLVFPPIIELISDDITLTILLKNLFILVLATLGMVTGFYESLTAIFDELFVQ